MAQREAIAEEVTEGAPARAQHGHGHVEAVGGFAPVVIVPTYHNAATLGAVLKSLASLNLPIIVVDDGCRDETPRTLEAWAAGAADGPARRVARHAANRGKGAALVTGFHAAAELGATHAATIDSDGQHDPGDVPGMLAAARAQPDALVIGVRPRVMPGRPARCLLGLRIANALVGYECGRELADSQSGMRVYPLDLVLGQRCRSGRFSYETEIITRAAWAGRPVIESPIQCRYLPADQRVSHWRPVVDTLRDARLHSRLLVEAVMRG